MSWFLLAARLLLGAVFVVAGIAKLLDRNGSKKAVTEFGLPQWAAAPLGTALPVIEIAVALLLFSIHTVWIGGLAALALLLVFIAAISINIGLGRRPSCHCFGQVNSKPVGWTTVARNTLLAAIAGVLSWYSRENPGNSIQSLVSDMSTAQILATSLAALILATLAGLSWLVLHLFRQHGRILLRLEALEASRSSTQVPAAARHVFQGLPIGSKAIPFDIPQLDGVRITLNGLLERGKPVLLISTNPGCGPCNSLMPEVARWQKDLATDLTIVLLSQGRRSDNLAKAAEHGLTQVVVEDDNKTASHYHVLGTPSAVLIRSDGTIGSPALGGADAIRRLISDKGWTDAGIAPFLKSLNTPPPQSLPPVPTAPSGLPVGSAAPLFTLPDVRGVAVSAAASFSGRDTALLFWNPGCGFCQRMLPALKEWELSKSDSSPQLVLISSGSTDVNRAMGLESLVLIDENFAIGGMYGCRGTPSALLVDAKGKITTPLVVGGPGVIDLLSAAPSDSAAHQINSLRVGAA